MIDPGALPVDAVDVIDAAFGIRGTRKRRYPILPQTAGLAIVLLVNRNTAQDRAIGVDHTYRHPAVDAVLCEAAETFARVLGYQVDLAWRGAALASLDGLTGPGLFAHRHMFWVDENRATADARDWVEGMAAGELFPRAFDALAGNLLSHGQLLNGWGCLHEFPGVTQRLRCRLQGHNVLEHGLDHYAPCFPRATS
jgi:hypothetical protein